LTLIPIVLFILIALEDEKLDLSLRPQDMNRISSVKAIVMDALEGSPSNIIPIGDLIRLILFQIMLSLLDLFN